MMSLRGRLSVLFAVLCGTALTGSSVLSAPSAPGIAIIGATVFDATGAAPKVETVLIRNGRIADVGPSLSIPSGFTRIDAKGEALLPGFFDVHTHWTPSGRPITTPDIANADVSTGVTTVADFNAAPESFEARRRWLSKLVTPHVNICARLSTPGGHGADWADTATTKMITTPGGARAAIDSLIPYKPDCFGEVMMDGWRYGMSPDDTSMNEDALTALVDEAHKYHIPVLTHTLRVEMGAEAGRAKVDIIDHALQDRDIDDAAIAAIKNGGSFFAPTLAVYEPTKPGRPQIADHNDPRYIHGQAIWGFAIHNTKRLYDAGVPIALGTDSGMTATPHGKSSLREMELLVQAAGLPPQAALIAGTANSAKAMYEFADRGSIEKGKRADLVLIKGKPWENINDVEKTDRVFIDGVLAYGPGTALNPVAPMAAVAVKPLVDDFERADLRSNLDTLVVTEPDGGIDRSTEIIDVVPREDGGHALSMEAKMAVKSDAQAAIVIPLTRGSITPADVRKYKGVKLDIRGDGPYDVDFNTLAGTWGSTITGSDHWKTVEIPFSDLKRAAKSESQFNADGWTGDNVTEIEIKAMRKSGEKTWAQIDNVEFY
jgi:imidazolonepropionase-like amidohydrolase